MHRKPFSKPICAVRLPWTGGHENSLGNIFPSPYENMGQWVWSLLEDTRGAQCLNKIAVSSSSWSYRELITLFINRAPSPSHQARKRANYIKSADEPGSTRICRTRDQTVAGDQSSNAAKSRTYWWSGARHAGLLSRNFQLPFKANRSLRRQLWKGIQELHQTQP